MNYNELLKRYSEAQSLDHSTRIVISKSIKHFNKEALKNGTPLFNPLDIFKVNLPSYYSYLISTLNIDDKFLKSFNTNIKVTTALSNLRKQLGIDILSITYFYFSKNIDIYYCGYKYIIKPSSNNNYLNVSVEDPITHKQSDIYVSDYVTSFSEFI